ncbi:Ctr copper transporter [Gymnopilus junonius]|uniref:Copper transport protein n=1 Tax=Gymnopilus junonius TaxID=109634 RepID=A0A9P5NJX4_GYMJU|nr:Ctr copper transporter [Gymnopilus junonius]
MVMNMDGAMSLTSANMVPYLHFSPGDTVWFLGWVPESAGAMVGTCIGLFMLALVERWLAAIRATAERNWPIRQIVPHPRNTPPFIFSHDVPRGILHAGQSALGFAFMLVVMTYQAAFLISIVVGLGVGEMIFGRHVGAASAH